MTAFLNDRIEIIKGDITKLNIDAIVNAANSSLLGGGGVDGAIHRAAGPELLNYCRKLNGCPTGNARITPGFKLSAKHVIHTVGPVWRGGNYNEENLLANCYKSSLRLAVENELKSIAFPAISTGVYGYPLEEATNVAVQTVMKFLQSDSSINKVIFVCFDERTFEIYNKLLSL